MAALLALLACAGPATDTGGTADSGAEPEPTVRVGDALYHDLEDAVE